MNFCVAVFRSKTNLFEFIDYLRFYGVYVTTTGTPKEARIGCGISAKFDLRYADIALQLINGGRFQSFYGLFKIKNEGGKTVTMRIYP